MVGVAGASHPVRSPPEHEPNHAGLQVIVEMRAAWIVEDPLDMVVLIVVPGVVFRSHSRVAKRNLPDDDALLDHVHVPRQVANIASEIAGVPPGAAIAVLRLLEARVPVTPVRKAQVEVGTGRQVEVA